MAKKVAGCHDEVFNCSQEHNTPSNEDLQEVAIPSFHSPPGLQQVVSREAGRGLATNAFQFFSRHIHVEICADKADSAHCSIVVLMERDNVTQQHTV